MDAENRKLIEFLVTVFFDMRMGPTDVGEVNLLDLDKAHLVPHSKFRQQLKMMYRALDPMHRSGFETLFKFLPITESNAHAFMSSHCTAVWNDCTIGYDVFLHLMYTCSFTYSLLEFCESKGEPAFIHFFTKWMTKLYTNPIKPMFDEAGGWDGLDAFCSSLNLHLILDFINHCYNRQGKLLTEFTIGKSFFFFGIHHDGTLLVLKNKFKDFKNSVLSEFKNEISRDFKYKIGVMLALIKIELALEHVASTYNPPSPQKRLLSSTLHFFENYLRFSIDEIPDRIKQTFFEQERVRNIKDTAHADQEQSHEEKYQVNGKQDNSEQIQCTSAEKYDECAVNPGLFAKDVTPTEEPSEETPTEEHSEETPTVKIPITEYHSLEVLIAALQRLHYNMYGGQASNKHSSGLVSTPDIAEQVPNVAAPDIIAEACAAENVLVKAEQGIDTVGQELSNEDCLNAPKTAPAVKKCVCGAEETTSPIKKKPVRYRRLVLVKKAPGDPDSSSESDF